MVFVTEFKGADEAVFVAEFAIEIAADAVNGVA